MNANLVLLKKNGSSRTFELPADVTIVGRRQECDLCVPLMVVSRRHCEINRDQGALHIRDLGSRNGTFVNGERITETVLKPGDKVKIGPVCFGVQIDGEPTEMAVPDSAILSPPADSNVPEPAKLFEQENPFAEIDAVETHDGGDDVIDVFEDLAEDPEEQPAAE